MSRRIQIEQTDKKWKGLKAIAGAIGVTGCFFFMMGVAAGITPLTVVGGLAILGALGLRGLSSLGAWWTNG